MDSTTIVAVIILLGVFILMGITLYIHGIEAAVKLWSVMGTLTGVAFGSITSFYFTNKLNRQEIQQANLQKELATQALNNATTKANEVNKIAIAFATQLKEEKQPLSNIPPDDRVKLANNFETISAKLDDISQLNEKFIHYNSKKPTNKSDYMFIEKKKNN